MDFNLDKMSKDQYIAWKDQKTKTKKTWAQKAGNAVAIDKETGEVLSNVVAVPNFLPQHSLYAQQDTELKEYHKTHGYFIFTFYKLSAFVDDGKLKQVDLGRLIYLATYLYNDGNELKHSNGKFITKKTLPELLQLKARAFATFYKKIVELGILIEYGNCLRLNSEYFYKGALGSSSVNYKEISYTRTYVNSIRELYKVYGGTKSASKLGILYLIIPYIHYDTNYLCTNVEAKTTSEIDKLNITELAEILGYSEDKLPKALNSILLGDEYVFAIMHVGKEKFVKVNPRIFWRANYAPDKTLLVDFEIKKASKKRKE